MLVLTRKNGQKIQIGDDITITVLRVKGRSVRVGIDAPEEVRIVRSELPVLTEAIDLEFDDAVDAEIPSPTPSHDDPVDRREKRCRLGSSEATRALNRARVQTERSCLLGPSSPRSNSGVRMPARMNASAVGSMRIH